MKNKEFSILQDIKTNQLHQLHLIIPEKLAIKNVDGINYIYFTPKKQKTKGESDLKMQLHNEASALIDLLEIGYFIHEEMVNSYYNINHYYGNGSLLESDKFPILIDKIFKFCKSFGVEPNLKSSYDSDRKFIPRVFLTDYLYHSSKIYLWYRDFKKNTNQLNYLMEPDLRATVHIDPVVKNGKITELRYSFNSIFDLIDYQFLLYLRGVQEFNIGLCPYCHTFFKKNRGQKYCSPSHGDYDRKRLKYSDQKNDKSSYDMVKYCKLESCGKPFIPTNQKQKYCPEPKGKCKKIADNLAYKNKLKSKNII